ncbi:phage baseplate plug family protein [Entomohabitans teleogrylli]|uniref:phage baseplate plug family protein n=1 Tax=Entomohabitans teleogrylli TaxID=1384589 RepID=UPI000A54365E
MNIVNIPLEVLPNQSLTIRLGDNRYWIQIITISNSLMSISIARNDALLIQNQRAVSNQVILSQHNSKGYGNFVFVTPDETYPYYTEFNNGHELYFIPEE